MEIIGPFILSLLSGLSTLLGCIFIYIKVNRIGEYIVLFLSISMSTMIMISLFDLLPTSIMTILNEYGVFYGLIISILVFLLGYLIIDFLNNKISNNNSLYNIGIISMISLILHNLLEGLAVFMSAFNSIKLGIKMFLAIMLHNIPEGISISIPLYFSGESRGRVVALTLLSGLSEPLGALLSYIFLKDHINNLILSYILIVVSGLMISLSINDIYKEIKTYNYNNKMYHGLILGVILSIIVILI